MQLGKAFLLQEMALSLSCWLSLLQLLVGALVLLAAALVHACPDMRCMLRMLHEVGPCAR
jgi:hypothetical protein